MKKVVILVLTVLFCLGLILSGCDRYTYKTVTQKKSIPYKTFTKENPEKWEGEKEVIQPGESGGKIITFQEKYENGVLIDQEQVKEEITKKPKNRIVEVGTKRHVTGFVWEVDNDYPSEEKNSGKIEITVTNVRRFNNISPELGPSRNGDFLNITFHIKNNTDKPYVVDEFKFKLGNKVIEREQSFGPSVKDLEKLFTCYGTLLDYNQERAYNQPFTMVNETFLGGEEGNITLSYDLHFGSIDENTEIDGPEDLVIKYNVYPYQFLPLDKFWQGPFN